MADQDKLRIRPLDEKSDYSLWRLRIKAAISSKGLRNVFLDSSYKTAGASTPDAPDVGQSVTATEDQKEQASNIIVSALGDHALRVVRSVIGLPHVMLQKLDARYDSKSTATRISKMAELVCVKFTNAREDISKHVDRLAGLLEQLRSMNTPLPDSLAIGILVASIEVSELTPVTAAIKTLADKDLNWEEVSSRLIEECKALRTSSGKDRAAAASCVCALCHKPGHDIENCFQNPLNPNNRLNLSDKSRGKRQHGGKDRNGQKKNFERAAMARPSRSALNGLPPDRMLLDSGTTSHMTPLSNRVHGTTDCDVSIRLADDSTVKASATGVRSVHWMSALGRSKVNLSDTLVAKDVALSLLSVPALARKNIATLFMPDKAFFIDLENKNSILGQAARGSDGLFYIEDCQESVPVTPTEVELNTIAAMRAVMENDDSVESAEVLSDEPDLLNPRIGGASSNSGTQDILRGRPDQYTDEERLWHLRMGHALPLQAVKGYLSKGLLPHVAQSNVDCEPCVHGKERRRFRGSLTSAARVGRLHCDTKGKVDTQSDEGHGYFLTVVDEFSRFTHVCPLRSKSEASDSLLSFIRRFEKQTGHTVTGVHTDGGTEFRRALDQLDTDGVDVSTTTPYTPESNGLAERTHAVITSLARACIKQSKLPMGLWHHAVRHVTDARNAVKHSTTKKLPFESAFGHSPPYVKHMRPFGCRALYRPSGQKLPVFGSRVRNGLLLRHEGGGIYRILTDSGTVRTKHVRFEETSFPGMSGIGPVSTSDCDTEESIGSIDLSDNDILDDVPHVVEESQKGEDSDDHIEAYNSALTYVPPVPSTYGASPPEPDTGNLSAEDPEDEVGHEEMTQVESALSPLHDDEGPDVDDSITAGVESRAQQYNLRPARDVHYSAVALPDAITTNDDPSLKVALSSPERSDWLAAINKEFSTLTSNGTWKAAKPPPGNRPLPSGVILRLKRDSTGRPARFKARLVARGNFQSEVNDYTELYAPVACIELVRVLLSISVSKGWVVHQVDVKGAFLHAALPDSDDIWIRLPTLEGVPSAGGQTVKLVKSLYGIKQAPKLWYEHFSKTIARLGFARSKVSDCLFSRLSPLPVHIVVYVDDLLIIGSSAVVSDVKKQLSKLLTVTDLGACSYFLGINISKGPRGLFLSQSAYSVRLVESSGMAQCKPVKSPLPLAHPLYDERRKLTESEVKEMVNKPYRSILGALLYLSTRSRPDLAVAVSLLGKYQSEPGPEHWQMLRHVVRYLSGTTDYGLLLPTGSGEFQLEAWCDADWAREKSSRRSRSGYMATLNGGPVLWTSKLQTATALSTAEAEFSALSACVREVRWLRDVMAEVCCPQVKATTIYQDNLGAISWTEHVQGLRKVKHVGIKYHYVRESVDAKHVTVQYTPSADNRADSLTKGLIGETFENHRRWLSVRDKGSLQ